MRPSGRRALGCTRSGVLNERAQGESGRRPGAGRAQEVRVAQAPPAPGTGNAPVARRVISPYTSGSVVYSPGTQFFRLPW